MVHFAFVAGWFILDSMLMVLFPNSYLVQDLLFFSNLGFCAMILTLRRFGFLDSILFAFLCGFLYDFAFANTAFLYAIVFTIIACIQRLWTKHMDETAVEAVILSIVTIFVKDLLVYLFMCFQRYTQMDFLLWVQRYELLSIAAGMVGMLAVYWFLQIKDDYLERKAQALRKGEKVEWYRLRSKD